MKDQDETKDKLHKAIRELSNSVDYIEENLTEIEYELIPHLKRVLHVQTFSSSYSNARELKIQENQLVSLAVKPLCRSIISLGHLHVKKTLNEAYKLYYSLNAVLRQHPLKKSHIEDLNEDLKGDLNLIDCPPSIEFTFDEIKQLRKDEETIIDLRLENDTFKCRIEELDKLVFVMERYLKCLALEMQIPPAEWDAEINPALLNWI